jgi:hypothetical protein
VSSANTEYRCDQCVWWEKCMKANNFSGCNNIHFKPRGTIPVCDEREES